ncbi:hypothetical protein [Actinomadura rugatobispora]|uniref:DUF2516 family protein n=1 Tax=Actinomadura rugatobispora TaxID=1994 RepID=A0ABW1A9U7_9ACTN|nr:hypothetical protein GCM10010200_047500 [Actinomadura rugatobispora]
MWAGLQIALIGVVGVAATSWALWSLRGSTHRRQVKEALLPLIGGLWFLFCFAAVVVFDMPFTPAPLSFFLFIALVWLVRKTWRSLKQRLSA